MGEKEAMGKMERMEEMQVATQMQLMEKMELMGVQEAMEGMADEEVIQEILWYALLLIRWICFI